MAYSFHRFTFFSLLPSTFSPSPSLISPVPFPSIFPRLTPGAASQGAGGSGYVRPSQFWRGEPSLRGKWDAAPPLSIAGRSCFNEPALHCRSSGTSTPYLPLTLNERMIDMLCERNDLMCESYLYRKIYMDIDILDDADNEGDWLYYTELLNMEVSDCSR